MESLAQSLMGLYNQPDKSAFLKKFNSTLGSEFQKDQLRALCERTREAGNRCCREHLYKEAEQHYQQALAGYALLEKNATQTDSTQPSVFAYLHSNLSFTHFQLSQFEKALEAAQKSIREAFRWGKAWYRAYCALEKLKRYDDALKVLQMALRCEPDDLKLLAAQKEITSKIKYKKMWDRVQIDYSRFQNVNVEDTEVEEEAIEATPEIEFADDLNEEQRRHIKQLLWGTNSNESKAPTVHAPVYSFNPNLIYEEHAEITIPDGSPNAQLHSKPSMRDLSVVGLGELLTLISTVREPLRSIDSLYTPFPYLFTDALNLKLTEFFKTTSAEDSKILLLGIGTALPLLHVAKKVKKNWKKEVETNLDPNISIASCLSDSARPIVACSGRPKGDFGLKIASRLLFENQLDPFVHLVSRRFEELHICQPNDDPYVNCLADLTSRPQLVILDPSLIDSGILGKRILSTVSWVRKNAMLLTSQIFPNRLEVYFTAISINLPNNLNFKLPTVKEWCPYFDSINLKEDSPYEIKMMTSIHRAFTFDFSGPIENLEKDIPLSSSPTLLSLPSLSDGSIRAILWGYRLYDTCTSDTHPIVDRMPDVTLNQKQSIQWMDSVQVKKNEAVQFEFWHTPTRIKLRIQKPCLSPSLVQNVYRSISAWNYLVQPLFMEKLITLFKPALDTSYNKALHRRPIKSSYEILCIGAGDGVYRLWCVALLRTMCEILFKTMDRPHPQIRCTIIEPLVNSLNFVKQCIQVNVSSEIASLTEQLNEKKAVDQKDTAWQPVSTLINVQKNENKTLIENTQKLETDKKSQEISDTITSTQTEPSSVTVPDGIQTGNCNALKTGCKPEAVSTANLSDSPIYSKCMPKFKFMKTDTYELRFEKNEEDSHAQLFLSKLRNCHPTQLPVPSPSCIIPSTVDTLIINTFENGYSLRSFFYHSKYLCNMYLKRKESLQLLPKKAILQVLLVNAMTLPNSENFTLQFYKTYLDGDGYLPFVMDDKKASLSIHSDVVNAFTFEFNMKNLSSNYFDSQSKIVPIQICRSGTVNSIIFWYDLYFNETTILTNRPAFLPSSSGDSTYISIGRQQAIQRIEEMHVTEDATLPICIKQKDGEVSFELDTKNIENFHTKRTQVAIRDEVWTQMNGKVNQHIQQFCEKVFLDPKNQKWATQAATSLCVDPGRQIKQQIEPEDANLFVQTCFS